MLILIGSIYLRTLGFGFVYEIVLVAMNVVPHFSLAIQGYMRKPSHRMRMQNNMDVLAVRKDR